MKLLRPLACLTAATMTVAPAVFASGTAIALAGPGGVVGWGVVGWLAADGAGGGTARSVAYRQGQQALDAGNWKEAAETFRRLAAENGGDADAALYWQAYALGKQGKEAEALAVLRQLRGSHPQSGWLDDAQALELEMRGPGAAVAAGSAAESEELKVYALNGLMQADSARAVPVLQKFLQGNASPRLKKQALFVLGQSDSAEARQLLASIAHGRTSPGLQTEAIEMLGIAGGKSSVATLLEIFRGSGDIRVKQAVLQAFLVAGADEEVLAIARGDKDPAMRRRAIQQLGPMGANAQLRQLYAQESAPDLRLTVLEAMGVAGDVEGLAQAARSETDGRLRRAAIHGLGISGGTAASTALRQLYGAQGDAGTRRAVIEALFIQDNAKALIELFRAEKDAQLRREIVQKLSLMDSPEATDLLLKMLDE